MVQPKCRYRNRRSHYKIAAWRAAVALQFSALLRIFPPQAGVACLTHLLAVRRGFSLTEVVAVCTIAGLAMMIALPRAMRLLDRIAVDRAAREITLALAVARHTAVAQGSRVRAGVAADSIRLDRWHGGSWRAAYRWPG
ncbi:MAG: pilus assembly FimT family protein, partial [Burkholderiales bacterium]